MRITGGTLRGRTIPTSGFQGIRPTTDRARETMFNILANYCDFEQEAVLDLCAGSGALGIEALSRGAAFGLFVEKSRSNARLLAQTLDALQLQAQTHVLATDVLKGIAAFQTNVENLPRATFSCIFCDPPYSAKLINSVFSALAVAAFANANTNADAQKNSHQILAPDCIFVAEHDTREVVLVPQGWQKLRERSFGETVVEFFQRT